MTLTVTAARLNVEPAVFREHRISAFFPLAPVPEVIFESLPSHRGPTGQGEGWWVAGGVGHRVPDRPRLQLSAFEQVIEALPTFIRVRVK